MDALIQASFHERHLGGVEEKVMLCKEIVPLYQSYLKQIFKTDFRSQYLYLAVDRVMQTEGRRL